MQASQRQPDASGPSAEARELANKIARPVSQRVFESVLGDIERIVFVYRARRREQTPGPPDVGAATVALLEDRVSALAHLAHNPSVGQALEQCETALAEAVAGRPDVIDFERARHACRAEEKDRGGPDYDSGTEVAISNSNSNT